MHRQLRELDRWYAQESLPSAHRGDGGRRFLVGSTTAVVAVLATGHVLNVQGLDFGLDGIHARHGAGPSRPAIGSGSYRFIAHQAGRPDDPVTYDPCRPIHVVVNDRIAPAGADDLLDQALSEVAGATGLTFVRDGRTDELPRRDRPLRDPGRYGRGWSPVVVGWTTPDAEPGLGGRVVGLGGSSRVVDELAGRWTFVTGTVSLDTPALAGILGRPDGAAEVRAVLMHELGHVVGLAHVDDPGQLMYADNVGVTQLGPGDLTGLAALGRGRCAG
jgi:hypothetical protein